MSSTETFHITFLALYGIDGCRNIRAILLKFLLFRCFDLYVCMYVCINFNEMYLLGLSFILIYFKCRMVKDFVFSV